MDLSARVVGEIRAEMARQRLSGRSLAAQLGWSQVYLSRRLSGRTALDLPDVEAIAAVLEVPVAAFFEFPQHDGAGDRLRGGGIKRYSSLPDAWAVAA